MTDPENTPRNAIDGLSRQLWMTRTGMIAERAARSFWPALTVLMASVAALVFRFAEMVSAQVLIGAGVIASLALAYTVFRGLQRFVWPSRTEAETRLDATMPGRPIATLRDDPAIGQEDPASMAVWQAHLSRMVDRLRGARAPSPDLRVAALDPFADRKSVV